MLLCMGCKEFDLCVERDSIRRFCRYVFCLMSDFLVMEFLDSVVLVFFEIFFVVVV